MARPRIDPYSARSDARGIMLERLPAEGYKGRLPRWPKPVARDEDGAETLLSKRARAVWRDAWRTPQATKWIEEPWRFEVIAEYCVVVASVEQDTSRSAALIGQLHRYRDQLGLTPAGLKDNGWMIAHGEPAGGEGGKGRVPSAGSRSRAIRALPN